MRTALLADKLVECGHSVTWWTSAFDHFKKDWLFQSDTTKMLKDGLKLVALKGIGYRKNFSLARFIDHRLVARKFREIAYTMAKPDVIVTSMPPHDLAYKAVTLGKARHVPVLVDIRDPWPDIFLQHVPRPFQGALKMLLFRDFQMARKTMQMADGLLSVTNSFLTWGLQYADREKRPEDRVLPLGYKKHKITDFTEVLTKYNRPASELENKFVVFFVGSISRNYHDPSILLEAAERVIQNREIHFLIAGDGELFKELKEKTRYLPNVTFTGWLNQAEIEFWLQRVKIGICPATKKINLPTNKVYTYLSAGLPVISAFQGELKELIERYRIGFHYEPNDLDGLVKYIQLLYNNAILYNEMSKNAKNIFEAMFDADRIYTEYVNHIEKIAQNYRLSIRNRGVH